jgi:uncharacterized cupredoxin-like copper-binding protein
MLKRVIIIVIALGLVAVGCGSDDDTAAPNDDGVVEIAMKDSRFDPAEINVKAGEEVIIRITNEGELDHEAFIGTEAEQDAHEAEMRSGESADMTDTSHGEGHEMQSRSERELTLAPGDTGDLSYTAEESGTVLIGCHEPGHYCDGMKATLAAS